MNPKLTNGFYSKFVGCYAKRFYTSFEKENIFKIIDFRQDKEMSYVKVENDNKDSWEWDMEDTVIITNSKTPHFEDEEHLASVYDARYLGYSPYKKDGKLDNEDDQFLNFNDNNLIL